METKKIKESILFSPVGFTCDHITVDFLEKDILFTLKNPTRMFVKKKYKNGLFEDSFYFCFHLDDDEKSKFQDIEKSILSQYIKHPTIKNYYGAESVVEKDHLFVYNMLLFCNDKLEKLEKEIWENLNGDDEKAFSLLLELDKKDREQKEHKKYVWDHLQHQINKIPLGKDINKKIVSFPIDQDEIDYEELVDLVIPTFRIYGVMLKSSFHPLHLAIALDSVQIVLSPEKVKIASFIHAIAIDNDDNDGLNALVCRVQENL
jgi:hypothetical protein